MIKKLIFHVEDDDDAITYINALKYRAEINELWEELFRPRNKHGYRNEKINKLLENECCDKLMDELETIYSEVTSKEE